MNLEHIVLSETKPDTQEQMLHCNMYMRNLRYSNSETESRMVVEMVGQVENERY